MRDIIFRGKRVDNGEWVEGSLINYGFGKVEIHTPIEKQIETGKISSGLNEVIPETVGQYTGLGEVWEHDIVEIWGKRFEVVKECGAFGIVSDDTIDYELFEKKIKEYTGCDNTPCFCYNDNFISLWELYWNYNEEENNLFCVKVIGNIHDNPELLK